MKHTLSFLSVLAILLHSFGTFGQGCSPNPAFDSAPNGVYPYGPIQMDCSGENANVTIVGLSEFYLEILPGLSENIHFDAMRIDTVEGLPAGLTVETDVMGSAYAEAPYGEWLYTGSYPTFDLTNGCMNITGSAADWATAATGGPNGDGVLPLTITLEYRVGQVDSSLVPLIAIGQWFSTMPMGGQMDTVEVELRVNESACGTTLFITPQVTASTDTAPGCDGAVTLAVYNGQPPFTYLYSTGDTTETVTDLCPGAYTVQVTDANGLVESIQFAVGLESNVYSNVNPVGLPFPLDSLFGTYQTCDLDYTLPIDSFMITEALVAGSDTILVTWVAYQLGEPYTVESVYPFAGSNQTILSMVLYCENGRSEVGVFQLYDYVDLDAVGVEEEVEQLQFSVMPNPTSGLLTLQLDALVQQGQIDVFDPTGKRVQWQNLSVAGNNQLDLQRLADGLYTVRVSTQHGFGVKRIVKAGGVR